MKTASGAVSIVEFSVIQRGRNFCSSRSANSLILLGSNKMLLVPAKRTMLISKSEKSLYNKLNLKAKEGEKEGGSLGGGKIKEK